MPDKRNINTFNMVFYFSTSNYFLSVIHQFTALCLSRSICLVTSLLESNSLTYFFSNFYHFLPHYFCVFFIVITAGNGNDNDDEAWYVRSHWSHQMFISILEEYIVIFINCNFKSDITKLF